MDLLELNVVPVLRQKELLANEFENWLKVGGTEQIDDVCIVGVKI